MNTVGKAPGVYVQPLDTVGPIVGVGTSTVAMIGEVKTPGTGVEMGKSRAVSSWTVYAKLFGEFDSKLQLPYAVRGFFENGGSFLYVIPVASTGDLKGPIDELTRLSDVNIVCAPGVTDLAAQKALVEHCAATRNRVAVLDGPRVKVGTAPTGAGEPVDPHELVGLAEPLVSEDGAFAAMYWPWIEVSNPDPAPTAPKTVKVPPSGHVAGIMARSDARYGVHKAPANENVRGALDLDYAVNAAEQGELNHTGVNVIRRFAGRAPIVWGARTLSNDSAWRYLNVRRLVSFVEESLTDGLSWAVFEANTTSLWKSLERTISEFLDRIWQAGALFGRTAAEAYYVRIDEELNPEDVREQGQVVIEVGIAPVRPAEFVIVRLGLLDGSQSAGG